MRKTIIAAALGTFLGMDFGRKDQTKGVVMDSSGNIIDILDDTSKLRGQEPTVVIIDEVSPMMSGNLHDILTRPLKNRPAFTSPKPLTKRQKRRAKGKKQC